MTSTTTRVPSVIESSRPEDDSSPTDDDGDGGIPLWAFVLGGAVTLLIGGYMLIHAWSSASSARYAEGFLLEDCPICQDGHLILDERPYTVLGIPRVRRIVRCDNCRSVLREVGKYQWRYAVDPRVSKDLYDTLNNRVIHEQQLADLNYPYGEEPPEYVDEQ